MGRDFSRRMGGGPRTSGPNGSSPQEPKNSCNVTVLSGPVRVAFDLYLQYSREITHTGIIQDQGDMRCPSYIFQRVQSLEIGFFAIKKTYVWWVTDYFEYDP